MLFHMHWSLSRHDDMLLELSHAAAALAAALAAVPGTDRDRFITLERGPSGRLGGHVFTSFIMDGDQVKMACLHDICESADADR
jgi:hypothetical protein